MGFLTLGLDSFIACLAVGALVNRKAMLPFAALFGIADTGAFLLGTALHFEMPDFVASIVSSSALVVLGLYLIVVAVTARKVANTRWMWVLPFALTLDNISFGLLDHSSSVAVSAVEQLVSSAVLALAGIVVSAVVVRAVPKLRQNKALTAGIAGVAAIVAVPVLLAMG